MIEVSQLRKSYGPIKAIDGISFSAKPGEILGFLGPNGAGKSTTMRILAGFIAPTSGRALISGVSIGDLTQDARKQIGYLPEHAPAYPEMRVIDFLIWAAHLKGLSGQQCHTSVSNSIDRCGLGEMRHREVRTLSKGYRQRVGLAQALVHQPDVLILDEPFSGLDPNQISDMRAVIRQEGEVRTVLFSSHILSDVQAVADRIIIINRGLIVANQPLNPTGNQGVGPSFSVRLSGTCYAEVQSHAHKLQSVAQIKLIAETSDELIVSLASHPSEDPRNEFLRLVTENGWNLLHLEEMKDDLKAIFRQVTQGSK